MLAATYFTVNFTVCETPLSSTTVNWCAPLSTLHEMLCSKNEVVPRNCLSKCQKTVADWSECAARKTKLFSLLAKSLGRNSVLLAVGYSISNGECSVSWNLSPTH